MLNGISSSWYIDLFDPTKADTVNFVSKITFQSLELSRQGYFFQEHLNF